MVFTFRRIKEMPSAACPECEEGVFVAANIEQGTLVICDECGASLEIVGLDPIELDPYVESDYEEYGDGFNIYDEENTAAY